MLPPGGKLDLQGGAAVPDQEIVAGDRLRAFILVDGKTSAAGDLVSFRGGGEFLPVPTLMPDRC
eukprot:5607457-Alexandrium_andersonii.AAC.1